MMWEAGRLTNLATTQAHNLDHKVTHTNTHFIYERLEHVKDLKTQS